MTEERCGGFWNISSVNSLRTRSTSSRGTEEWIRITATYSLGKSRRSERALVACPSPMGRTPETPGSRVPLCPAFSIPMSLLTHATTSWLVGPAGLVERDEPVVEVSSIGLFDGSQPWLGSVGSSATADQLPAAVKSAIAAM